MTYTQRLQTCIRCEHSGKSKAACGRDGKPLQDHATSAACPDGLFPEVATPLTVRGAEVVTAPAATPVSEEEVSRRLGVCRGCEHSGAEGADGRSIYCGTCRTCNGGRGRMVSLTVGACPLDVPRW